MTVNGGNMLAHTAEEYLALDELERLCEVVLRVIMLAPEHSPRGGKKA